MKGASPLKRGEVPGDSAACQCSVAQRQRKQAVAEMDAQPTESLKLVVSTLRIVVHPLIESASLNLKNPFGLSLSKPCAALRQAQRERFKLIQADSIMGLGSLLYWRR